MMFANKVRRLKGANSHFQWLLATASKINMPMCSESECLEKNEQVVRFAELLYTDFQELHILWSADKVIGEVEKISKYECR